jgi:sporulation protein YlmC with PRC-barrel domain
VNESPHMLVRLQDDDPALPEPTEDTRGRKVVDGNGVDLGDVAGLVLDDDHRRVRFLEIAFVGPQGIGQTSHLVPVELVTRVDDQTVQISADGAKVAGSPFYAQNPLLDHAYCAAVYGYYDVPPFWWPSHPGPED